MAAPTIPAETAAPPALDALVQACWADHEKETAAVAGRLEGAMGLVENAAHGANLLNVGLHAIGQHLGDWSRASRLADAVLERLHGKPLSPGLLALVAVAKYVGGDVAGGLALEAKAAATAPADAASGMVRTRMLVAEALWAAERLGESLRLYEDALSLAEALPATSPAHRSVAVVSNNLASNLKERTGRTPAEDATMLRAARAARTAWLKIGDWTNDERSDYLLAIVANSLGDFDDAVLHAERGLTTIERNSGEKNPGEKKAGEKKGDEKYSGESVDAAFLSLALAEAWRGLSLHAEHAKALAEADRLAAGFDDTGLKDWYAKEAAKVR